MQKVFSAIQLNQMSVEAMQEHDDNRAFCQGMPAELIVTGRLQALAMTARKSMKPLTETEVLETFFDAEALPLMLSMPNLYWFWKVLHLMTNITVMTEFRPYSREDVVEAVGVYRAASSKDGPLKALEELHGDHTGRRETQIARHTARGLLMLIPSMDGTRHYLVDNPVYFNKELSH